MRKKLITFIVVIFALGLGIIGTFGWLGYQLFDAGFSARTEPHPIEVFLARQARRFAIPVERRNMPNPIPFSPEVLKEALAHFADHCAICHDHNGSGQTPIGMNVYPRAMDLRLADTQSMSDGELFWVIRNGISLTAMPAWGEGDPEQDKHSWKLVHFIRHLPQLTPEELVRLKALSPKAKHHLEEEAAIGQSQPGDDAAATETDRNHQH